MLLLFRVLKCCKKLRDTFRFIFFLKRTSPSLRETSGYSYFPYEKLFSLTILKETQKDWLYVIRMTDNKVIKIFDS